MNLIMSLFNQVYSPYVSALLIISGAICVLTSFVLIENQFKKEGKLSLYMGLTYIAGSFALFMLSVLI